MIELLERAIHTFNDLTPLGVIGILAYVVYLLVGKKGPVKTLGTNHLHSMPDIVASLARMEDTLNEINSGIQYLKGRLNGKSG